MTEVSGNALANAATQRNKPLKRVTATTGAKADILRDAKAVVETPATTGWFESDDSDEDSDEGYSLGDALIWLDAEFLLHGHDLEDDKFLDTAPGKVYAKARQTMNDIYKEIEDASEDLAVLETSIVLDTEKAVDAALKAKWLEGKGESRQQSSLWESKLPESGTLIGIRIAEPNWRMDTDISGHLAACCRAHLMHIPPVDTDLAKISSKDTQPPKDDMRNSSQTDDKMDQSIRDLQAVIVALNQDLQNAKADVKLARKDARIGKWCAAKAKKSIGVAKRNAAKMRAELLKANTVHEAVVQDLKARMKVLEERTILLEARSTAPDPAPVTIGQKRHLQLELEDNDRLSITHPSDKAAKRRKTVKPRQFETWQRHPSATRGSAPKSYEDILARIQGNE